MRTSNSYTFIFICMTLCCFNVSTVSIIICFAFRSNDYYTSLFFSYFRRADRHHEATCGSRVQRRDRSRCR